MAREALLPPGCWPALLRDEHAAAYAGERSVETFLSRVGDIWPKPYIDRGTGKGRYRVWRKKDLDQVIDPAGTKGEAEAW